MIIHQAYFGDDNGSHNLLGSSITDRDLIVSLKLSTDIPASITDDYPYISGGPIGDYYVFSRTMRDVKAERTGMAFTHCLILDIKLVGELNDLDSLFSFFVKEPVKNSSNITSFEVGMGVGLVVKQVIILNTIINSLSKNEKTVVYLGYNQFENTIADLWLVLPSYIKKQFSFTISGNPSELVDQGYTIIHTPAEFIHKWNEFSIIRPDSNEGDYTFVYRYLTDPQSPESILFDDFIKENDVIINSIWQLQKNVNLYDLIIDLQTRNDILTIKRIINSVEIYMPYPDKGVLLKKQIISIIAKSILISDIQGIKMLRNIKFESFAEWRNEVTDSFSKWLTNNIGYSIKKDDEYIIIEGFFGDAIDWWKDTVKSNIEDRFKYVNVESVGFIWSIWALNYKFVNNPSLVKSLAKSHEALIVSYAPKDIKPKVFEEIIQLSIVKDWYSLLALSAIRVLPVYEAIVQQTELDNSPYALENFRIISNNVTPADFIEAAVKITNHSVHKVAGEIVAAHVSLLKDLDLSSQNEQDIWYESFLVSHNIIAGLKKPYDVFFTLLDNIVEGKYYNSSLMNELAKELGNIFYYQKLEKLWPIIDRNLSEIIINKTSAFILEKFEELDLTKIDSVIFSYIVSKSFVNNQLVKNNSISIGRKIAFSEKFLMLSSGLLTDILKMDIDGVSLSNFKAISAPILKNRWKDPLDFLYSKRSSNKSIALVLTECNSMLSRIQRLLVKYNHDPISMKYLIDNINKQNLQAVFLSLDNIGVSDFEYNRLKMEYVSGVKGIDLNDLCERLKVYINSLF